MMLEEYVDTPLRLLVPSFLDMRDVGKVLFNRLFVLEINAFAPFQIVSRRLVGERVALQYPDGQLVYDRVVHLVGYVVMDRGHT